MQKLCLKLVTGGLQSILQFTEIGRRFTQQVFTAGNGSLPVLGQESGNIGFHLLLLLIHHTLVKINSVKNLATENFRTP